MSRVILYTGKGGIGKTSVALATAYTCAKQGQKTLVLSTDPAHSLSHALKQPIGAGKVSIGEGIWAEELSAREHIEEHWGSVQDWLSNIIQDRGINRITAEELTVPPGIDEFFALLALKNYHQAGEYDVIVVDCAPTGETLRMLAFPEVAQWWLNKFFPQQRDIMSAAKPIARALLDIPLPNEAALADIRGFMENLIAMNEILRNHRDVTVRLVMSPDEVVIKESMQTFTYLNLYGYLTDAIIVNRILPEEAATGYFSNWRDNQQRQLRLVESAFSPLPLLRIPYLEQEPIGQEKLTEMGKTLFASESDPSAVLYADIPQQLIEVNGDIKLKLPLPLADRDRVRLKKVGSELVLTVDDHKRVVSLPATVARLKPAKANLKDGILEVTFVADSSEEEQKIATNNEYAATT